MTDMRMATQTRRRGGGGSGGGGSPRWWWWWRVWWWCCCCCCWSCVEGLKDCKNDDGDDVAVAVVVSVVVTLLVVAIVLVVVYILLRRRHGGFLFPPKRTRKSLMSPHNAEGSRITHRDSCYDNPAFSAQETVDLEEGGNSTILERNSTSPRKDGQRTGISAVPAQQKSPSKQARKGSAGSLDDCSGPETVSVWLQSQDIIGLGFNIGGNMRDGIFVSQVHNRGPAVESGLIQVGDRIRRVSITYDNMVYEDALTILSYASPYPVQVTLQKERLPSADTLSRSSERLNHPLYRSQSLEDMQLSPRVVHVFKPKRWQSELRSETRKESPKRPEGDRRSKTLTQDLPLCGREVPTHDVTGRSGVMVHATDTADGSLNPAGYQLTREQTAPVKNRDLGSVPLFFPPSEPEEQRQAARNREKGREDAEPAPVFASLMDQTLDNYNKDDSDHVLPQAAAGVSTSPKTPPVKPERKKKTSSASLDSEDSLPLELSHSDGDVEEACVAVKTVHVQALPPGFQDPGPTVEEEEIQPTYVKREVVINVVEGLDFAPVDKSESQATAEERPASPNRYVYVRRSPRPASPESGPVEEDLIEAGVASRNTQAPPLPRSTKAQHTQSRDKMKDVRQIQDTSVLNDETLELLIHKNPSDITSDLDDRDSEEDPQDARSGFLLQHDSQQPSQDRTSSTLSGDFVTVDLSGTGESGDGVAFRNCQSDTQLLQHHSEDGERNRKNREDSLEWSGQRLVRSGYFSEIPQADSVSDWMDTLNDDEDNSTTSGQRSATDTNPESDREGNSSTRTLLPAGMFKGRENLANLSDLSNSVSSSRSSSPGLTNGPVSEEVSVRHLPGSYIEDGRNASLQLTPTSDGKANSKPVSFILNSSADDTAEC